jgi:hypothetical protein
VDSGTITIGMLMERAASARFKNVTLRTLPALQVVTSGAHGGLQWTVFDGGRVRLRDGGVEMEDEFLAEVFSLPSISVKHAVATDKQLWLGTDRALVIYDRATQGWSRMAVNAKHVDADVTSLQLKESEIHVGYGDDQIGIFDWRERKWTTADPAAEVASEKRTPDSVENAVIVPNAGPHRKVLWLLPVAAMLIFLLVAAVGVMAFFVRRNRAGYRL